MIIYTDGGSINNGKKDPNKPVYGAFGYVITNDNNDELDSGAKAYKDVTNNQMEISGVIHALDVAFDMIKEDKELCGDDCTISVVSDSQYVVSGYNEWLDGWIKKGWRNSEGKPTPNREYWQALLQRIDSLEKIGYGVKFTKVKGHLGKTISVDENPLAYYNERCDSILTECLNKYRK
jgi:ribonuclease HI